jgi:AcrR family transcriptional regulator
MDASYAPARARSRSGGLRRGSLTTDRIVAESLRLLDSGGVAGFSMPKLGRALGADPTAVYRHFASKDELILAIADRLIQEAIDGLTPSECWVETVIDTTRRLRRTYQAHPAAASLCSFRTTQRPAEFRVVDALLGAVFQAGFEGFEAAVVYRSIGDFALSWCGGEASFRAQPEPLQALDRGAWTQAYRAVERAEYPSIWRVRDELALVSDDDIFDSILATVITGLCQRAPRPCACGRHPRQVGIRPAPTSAATGDTGNSDLPSGGDLEPGQQVDQLGAG